MSEWIWPAACHAVSPRLRCHDWAGLSSPAVKNAISSSSANAPPTTRCRLDSRDAEVGAHRGGVLVLELGELGLDAAGDRDRARALGGGVLGDRRRHGVVALVDVGDEQHRLGGQRPEVAQRVRRVGGRRDGASGTAGMERVDQLAQPGLLGDRGTLAAARVAHDARMAALGLLEVGEDQLGLDRLDVGERIDAALGMDDRVVVVRAHDVDDRVGLADVREEAVAEALAAVRAGDEPGDVMEVDRVRHDVRRMQQLGEAVEALVFDGDDGDVRLDRRERVVRGIDAGLRERVEERRLAGVRHSDDADLHRGWARPAPPTSVPSSAPAAMSDG